MEDARTEGLRRRLGFDPNAPEVTDFRTAGVTFEGRQELLREMLPYCSFHSSPPVRVVREADNEYDKYAVAIMATMAREGKEPKEEKIGYIPKKKCFACGACYGGKRASDEMCPHCGTKGRNIRLNKIVAECMDEGFNILAGMDSVIENQQGIGNLGCVIYIKVEGVDQNWEESSHPLAF